MNNCIGKVIYCCLFFMILSVRANCQVFAIDNKEQELFLYEVKGIDEFMERFNDDKNTLIRAELSKNHVTISRKQMLVSLFNLNLDWTKDSSLVRAFSEKVLDNDHPQMLNFADNDWYAEAICVFMHDSKKTEIPVILHIIRTPGKSMKWMIAGIGDNLAMDDSSNLGSAVSPSGKSSKFIPPSAYATNFIELFNVFTESMNPQYFFEPQFLASSRGQKFINLVTHKKIQLQFVKSVKYHFLQIDNWIFSVEQFTRQQKNSGWLISKLRKVDAGEKETYKKQLLHL